MLLSTSKNYFLGKLNEVDIKVLKLLERLGPREGINRLYKELKEEKIPISYSAVMNKIKKALSSKTLFFRTIIDPQKLGLNVYIFKFKVKLKDFEIFEKLLEKVPGLVYYGRIYDKANYLAYFGIPKIGEFAFLDTMQELARLEIIELSEILVSKRRIYPSLGFEWYDMQRGELKFDWESLINDTEIQKILLDIVNEEKGSENNYFIELDDTDLLILKEIEKNPLIKIVDLADKLGLSPQLTRYHYVEHIEAQKLIVKFHPYLCFYISRGLGSYYYIHIRFTEESYALSFAESIRTKLFIHSIHLLNENGLLLIVELPYQEFTNVNRMFWEMAKKGIIKDYDMGMIDSAHTKSFTIPYELYKNGRWVYPTKEEVFASAENIIEVASINRSGKANSSSRSAYKK